MIENLKFGDFMDLLKIRIFRVKPHIFVQNESILWFSDLLNDLVTSVLHENACKYDPRLVVSFINFDLWLVVCFINSRLQGLSNNNPLQIQHETNQARRRKPLSVFH